MVKNVKNVALGMVETYGYVGAIEAADVCLKAANVTLMGCEFIKGGLVTIHIRGDVGAVKASIEAAESAVKKIGCLIATHVIPRPGGDVEKILPMPSPEIHEKKSRETHGKDQQAKEKVKQEVVKEAVDVMKKVKAVENNTLALDQSPKTKEALSALKTVDLRALARKMDHQREGAFSIERNQIKYSKKEELIEAILTFYKGVK